MTAEIATHIRQELTRRFGDRVRFDEPMAAHTTFKVGGPADLFVMPANEEEIGYLLCMARQWGLEHVVIGGGANILVRDRGIRGMVIALADHFTGISMVDEDPGGIRMTALAGTRLHACCRYAMDHGLAGLNFALGIPGSVGGAILMNAGASGSSMANVIRGIRIMTADTEVVAVGLNDLSWSYRELSVCFLSKALAMDEFLILSGIFELGPAKPEIIKAEAGEIMQYRRSTQPWDRPSAGCFFKNPLGAQSAGKLIEAAGLKGAVSGGAAVSEKHANFIVNRGNASAADIIRLSERIQETIYHDFGVALIPEVRIMGE
ncbi:MAG: UDP-N-acetylmuramate dehydrogenase [Desulfobacteraceae bacterium]|jgi:UDP-N-acetylmuramate dehydrogenase|nr:MAG: UDP-N-acetylmuramate dehydrogenase [Desulfobacteraceae bacterium]